MTYGQIVAARWKRQYFKRNKWTKYSDWENSPEQIYTVLLELRSKTAIEALLDKSWTRRLPKQPCEERQPKESDK